MLPSSSHILATKLFRPLPTTTLVVRPRLLEQLDAALRCPLTIVIAPPGFGKSTLVSTWAAALAARTTVRVGWLTVDTYDDEPAHFWTAVCAALGTIDPGLAGKVLPTLSGLTPTSPPFLLTPLVNELARINTQPILLVLDDYHAIQTPAVQAMLAFVVEHLPPHVHIVLASRSDPPLHLARLRARGQLVEVRAADLRFTRAETDGFCNEVMGLNLAPADVADLETRTEGWIAGLHLAALSMRNRTDRAAFVRQLKGSHHFIVDYLVEEVIQHQPTSIRDFLLQTSILDRFCVSLCDAVTGGQNAAASIQAIERANLFVVPLDDERVWYRYHHLFVDLLRARLAEEQPQAAALYHRRACDWYAQRAGNDLVMRSEAIRHALAAGEGDIAVGLINEVAEWLWRRNELTLLRTWLQSLPEPLLAAHPQQAIRLAQMLVANGSLAAVPQLLAIAAAGNTGAPAHLEMGLSRRIAVVRSSVAMIDERYDETIALAQEALQSLPPFAHVSRTLASHNIAAALHRRGDLAAAARGYYETIALCEDLDDRFMEITARCLLGTLRQESGDLQAAEAAFREAYERAVIQGQRVPIAGWPLIGLGMVAYARNDLHWAAELAAEGLELAQRGAVYNGIYHGLRLQTRLQLARQDFASARDTANKFVQYAQASQVPQHMHWASTLRALVDLRSGHLAAVERWSRAAQPRPAALYFPDKLVSLLYIRLLLAGSQLDDLLAYAADQAVYLEANGHVETLIDLRIMQACAHAAKSDPETAGKYMESALTLAAPAGFIRVFVNAGQPAATLLAQRSQQDSLSPFVAQLLAALAHDAAAISTIAGTHTAHGPGPAVPTRQATQPVTPHVVFPTPSQPEQSLVEPLSERELEVLHLMAAGRSNQEIADRLIISLPTVKKHGSNIFGKLQVSNRTEAVARGRALGLLP